MKSHFKYITSEKFQRVIKELTNFEIYPNSENDHLPDHKLLADKLKFNQIKMNKILRDLLENLIMCFNDHPLIIKNIVHILEVTPYIEPEEDNKAWIQKQWEKAISIPVVLPVTPKIGDYVEIPIMRTSYSFSTEDKYYSGYVHEVRHTINGTTQEILIVIYPFKSIYYKWEEMKKEYEDHQRRMKWLKADKDRT